MRQYAEPLMLFVRAAPIPSTKYEFSRCWWKLLPTVRATVDIIRFTSSEQFSSSYLEFHFLLKKKEKKILVSPWIQGFNLKEISMWTRFVVIIIIFFFVLTASRNNIAFKNWDISRKNSSISYFFFPFSLFFMRSMRVTVCVVTYVSYIFMKKNSTKKITWKIELIERDTYNIFIYM